jgi:hypothetical protein
MNKQEILIKEIAQLNINTLTEEDIIRVTCNYGLVYDPHWDCGEWDKYKVENWTIPGIYQTPRQIAECIMELLKYDINTYLEVGIFQGGSYLLITNFLKLKNPNIKCIGIDISREYMPKDVEPYIDNYTIGTSKDFSGQKFDLVFIDGDHSLKGALTDWLNVGQFAKIAMFHDIVQPTYPDLIYFWNCLKVHKQYKEYCYQTIGKDVQGIGLLFNTPI